MRKIYLIGNPIAGGGALGKIQRAASILADNGADVQVMLTEKRGDAEHLAGALRERCSTMIREERAPCLVIAAGGDGTYNEVANGLAYSTIPMAILPLGTSSVLARELTIPADLNRALSIALYGIPQPVHLGKITYTPNPKLSGTLSTIADTGPYPPCMDSRYFLLMAGIGFDAATVFGVDLRIKRRIHKLAYILSGLRLLSRYAPSPITITTGEMPERYRGDAPTSSKSGQHTLTGYNVIVSKASCYGGSFRVTPDARLSDPSLHVFVTHKKGRLSMLRYAAGIVSGLHLRFSDISYFSTTGLRIEGSAHIQIDGDYIGLTPAMIALAPDALQLVTPMTAR